LLLLAAQALEGLAQVGVDAWGVLERGVEDVLHAAGEVPSGRFEFRKSQAASAISEPPGTSSATSR